MYEGVADAPRTELSITLYALARRERIHLSKICILALHILDLMRKPRSANKRTTFIIRRCFVFGFDDNCLFTDSRDFHKQNEMQRYADKSPASVGNAIATLSNLIISELVCKLYNALYLLISPGKTTCCKILVVAI